MRPPRSRTGPRRVEPRAVLICIGDRGDCWEAASEGGALPFEGCLDTMVER
jgi:hypothetical protein